MPASHESLVASPDNNEIPSAFSLARETQPGVYTLLGRTKTVRIGDGSQAREYARRMTLAIQEASTLGAAGIEGAES